MPDDYKSFKRYLSTAWSSENSNVRKPGIELSLQRQEIGKPGGGLERINMQLD